MPTKLFWKASKHVLWYLRGTSQFGLWYNWGEGVKLCRFIDAHWVWSLWDWKSTPDIFFIVGISVSICILPWVIKTPLFIFILGSRSEFFIIPLQSSLKNLLSHGRSSKKNLTHLHSIYLHCPFPMPIPLISLSWGFENIFHGFMTSMVKLSTKLVSWSSYTFPYP